MAAPNRPPTTAPATGLPAAAPTRAPPPAPMAPPVRARSTGRSPQAAVATAMAARTARETARDMNASSLFVRHRTAKEAMGCVGHVALSCVATKAHRLFVWIDQELLAGGPLAVD